MVRNDFGYSEQLPESLRDVFMWLCQDVASLQHKWDFWLEIFGKQENADLLSKLAPASYNIILEAIRNDVTVAICRLSDPAKSNGQTNLSFSRLSKICTEVRVEGMEERVLEFRRICEPVRKRKNKRVGHRDLDSVIKPLENPLPGVSKEEIESILKMAEDVLNFLLKKFENSEMYFHIIQPGGAEQLMYWLKKGKATAERG